MAPDANEPTPTPPFESDALEGTSYRALSQLGKGGMGVVYEAEHVQLAKRFVVKVLRRERKDDAPFVDRMRVEAQAIAQLDSPHIVQVTDCGVTGSGLPFYVMEHLAGRTLRDELKERGALPVAEALEVARQVLEALRVVHAAHLVHRDVKPDNIFYCSGSSRRIVKLLDFGIVKVLSDEHVKGPMKPTDLGVAMGTPRYFAPEQALGWAIDARADIYAVGILLYVLLVGRGPFDDKRDLLVLFEAHMKQVPEAPSLVAPQSVPASVDRIVQRALEKRPADRFASAEEFLAALDEAEAEARQPAAAATGPSPEPDTETTTLPERRTPSPQWLETVPLAPRPVSRGRFGTEEMPVVARAALALRASPPVVQPLAEPPRPANITPSARPPSARAVWLLIALGVAALALAVAVLRG
jgi:serine/threonine-protein kinase